VLAWGICTLFSVGFIYAFNMAGGANGMVPGIAPVAFGILFLEYGRLAWGVIFFVCLVFLILNVVSGWFFLGDIAIYGLGACLFVTVSWECRMETCLSGSWRQS
jgi:UDP-GlcNAc:undecaprenyl-phosphate GlcNAc-1-phosphate transferase